jgi:4-hydroxy 2-oxovalerate aldolase
MLNIIDVTLRDGGHAVDFNWSKDLAQQYYKTISNIKEVGLIEMGYWGQTAKSNNTFYNLDFEKVNEITNGAGNRNVSVMIDYHYCSKNIKDYPDNHQNEIDMIRMCARKTDIEDALLFANKLKNETGLKVSFNIFNASNYSHEELRKSVKKVIPYNLDYVYFADTHGCIDMSKDSDMFKDVVKLLKDGGVKAGMHLHDHSGKAYYNYRMLEDIGFESADASTRGMGKGVGNLKLEHIVPQEELSELLELIRQNEDSLTMRESPYGIITSKYSLTDYYGYNAEKLGISIPEFDKICQNIEGIDKDVYNKLKLERKVQ